MAEKKRRKSDIRGSSPNDDLCAQLVAKFCELTEDTFTITVVIPVLQAEGFQFIDYTHGQRERGKDLVFWKPGEFGSKELLVAQIKMCSLTSSASDENGLPVVVTQLRQALHSKVVSWDGIERKPTKVFCITAAATPVTTTESDESYAETTRLGGRIVSGSEIAASLLTNRRDIAQSLLHGVIDVSIQMEKCPTNRPLSLALGVRESRRISNYFAELDATVGGFSLRELLRLDVGRERSAYEEIPPQRITPMSTDSSLISHIAVVVPYKRWPKVLESMERLNNHYPTMQPFQNAKGIDRKAREQQVLHESAENLGRQEVISAYLDELSVWASDLSREMRERGPRILTDSNYLSSEKDSSKFIREIATLRSAFNDLQLQVSEWVRDADNFESLLPGMAGRLRELIDALENISSPLRQIEKSVLAISKSQSTFHEIDKISVLGQLAGRALRDLEDSLGATRVSRIIGTAEAYICSPVVRCSVELKRLRSVADLAKKEVLHNLRHDALRDTESCAVALKSLQGVLSCFAEVLATEELRQLFVFGMSKDIGYSISAPIFSIMRSGVDLLITGNAGAGKSTTLETFALNTWVNKESGSEVFFLKVATLDAPLSNERPLAWFARQASKQLMEAGQAITPRMVEASIVDAKFLTLVLDGVDEARERIENLVELIRAIRKERPGHAAFIVSSRFSEATFQTNGLFEIELLPFKPEQLRRFIHDYLENYPGAAEEVLDHIAKNPNLEEICATPLMATILCVLQINGVRLPSSLPELYLKRFELLWGAYDAVKGVSRLSSASGILRDVSSSVAYYLHTRKLRTATREAIERWVAGSLEAKYSASSLRTALEELIEPANVLVRDGHNFGFGHLSYQEFLVALEMREHRRYEARRYLSSRWWSGVFVFFAQLSDDLPDAMESLLVQSDAADMKVCRHNLAAMIKSRPEKERKALYLVVENGLRTEMDDLLTGYGTEFT